MSKHNKISDKLMFNCNFCTWVIKIEIHRIWGSCFCFVLVSFAWFFINKNIAIQGMIFKNNKIWFPWIINSNFITICKWYTDCWLALSEQELKKKVLCLIRSQMQFSCKFYQALRFGFLHGKQKQKRTSHNHRMYAIIMFAHLFHFPKIKISKYKSMQLL